MTSTWKMANRVMPNRVMLIRVMPNRVMPNRVMPNRVMSNRVMPNRVMPNRVMPNRVMVQTWCVMMMMNIRRQKEVILNVGWGWDICYVNIGFSPRPGLSVIKKSMVGNVSDMRGYMGKMLIRGHR